MCKKEQHALALAVLPTDALASQLRACGAVPPELEHSSDGEIAEWFRRSPAAIIADLWDRKQFAHVTRLLPRTLLAPLLLQAKGVVIPRVLEGSSDDEVGQWFSLATDVGAALQVCAAIKMLVLAHGAAGKNNAAEVAAAHGRRVPPADTGGVGGRGVHVWRGRGAHPGRRAEPQTAADRARL
mmetsp:Transcript_1543/g.3640  ORF Transcript_1543/g.3640 Transcript_1543/m.3640 type:complete len:183 (+) Transcript_1543:228-776(+)